MNANTFELRPMVPEDCTKMPGLLERVHGIRSDATYWRWKYFGSSFETRAYVTQNKDDEILAFTGFWINEARIGGRDFPVYQLIDVMADVTSRGLRAYSPILKLIKDMVLHQNKVMYGFTNDFADAFFGKVFKDETLIRVENPVYYLAINPSYLIEGSGSF